MTRLVRSTRSASVRKKKRHAHPQGRPWPLQDAKASFSEVVRRAKESGPQRVTLRGKEAAIVVSPDDFAAMTVRAKYPTLRALLAPLQEIEIERRSIFPKVRAPLEL